RRVALAKAREAIVELSELDQALLRSSLNQARSAERTHLEAQRERVQLHRARNRLRDKLDGVLGLLGLPAGLRLRLRLLLSRPRRPIDAPMFETGAALAMAVF